MKKEGGKEMKKEPDITVENYGSIILFRPENIGAEEWLEENTDGQWFGGALAVEPRYAGGLADGAMAAGWEVEGAYDWEEEGTYD